MLKNFTMGEQHEFKDELRGMCKFVGGQPPITLYHDKLEKNSWGERGTQYHKLYMKYDGEYIGVIMDDTLHGGDNTYELMFWCDLDDSCQIRVSLAQVAAFLSDWQQNKNLAEAVERMHVAVYGEGF